MPFAAGIRGSRGRRIVKQFGGGLVFETHRLLYHSTLGSIVIKKKREFGLYVQFVEVAVDHTLVFEHRPLVGRQI